MTQKRVKTSDVIGSSYYNYELTSTNNTPSKNSTISITCKVTNIYGQAVNGKSVTLYLNNTSQGAKTTSNDGSATWNNISMTTSGLQVFSIENSKIEVFVDNKSEIGHTHSQYLTAHQDISGKIDTAGTGLSKNGTTLNHSNSITAQTTNVFKKIKYDEQGHITGTTNVVASDLPSHTHTSSQISDLSIPSASTTIPSADTTNGNYGTGTTWARSNHTHPKSSLYAEASHTHNATEIIDSTAHTNIGSSANATQKAINDAIDAKLASWTWQIGSPYSGVDVYYNDFLVCVVINGGFQAINTKGIWTDMEATATPIDNFTSLNLTPPTHMTCKSDGTANIFIRLKNDGIIQAMNTTGTTSAFTGRAIFTYKRR